MKTKLTNLLGVEYPIIQGGMAWIADANLAGAVSNGGGLGLIAGGGAPAEVVRAEIKKIKEMTDKPYGVNVMLLSPFAKDIAQLVIEERVPVVTTGAGNPGPFMAAWKEAGIIVIPVIASVAYAKRMQKIGADAVIAEGTEAGGHIGEITTMALVPQVVDAVDIPVIGAGGVADGRGLAAMFMLGACGAQVGTRFLVAHECTVHQNYKTKVLEAKDTDTAVTGRVTGHPVRCLKNRLTREYNELDDKGATLEEYEELGASRLKMAAKDGDVKYGSVMAGAVAGLVKKEQSAAEIVHEICDEAEKLISGGLILE